MQRLAGRFRCVAPDLRGYGGSSAPPAVEDYRPTHLMADVAALVAELSPGSPRLAALVAHDWGGAVAWNLAAASPHMLERLVIVNSPPPVAFLQALQHDPAQQAASAYMNFLCRPDAGALLAEDDFARLFAFFTRMGAEDVAHPGGGWLTAAMRERYRAVWRRGLTGPLNWYRASPLRPPTAEDRSVMSVRLPVAITHVAVPTLVLWGTADTALPETLLDGLERQVPDLRIVRIPGATHWVIHEQPARIAAQIAAFVCGSA
jgi:pimeloyl-ACP methyl ester carboxylesterase